MEIPNNSYLWANCWSRITDMILLLPSKRNSSCFQCLTMSPANVYLLKIVLNATGYGNEFIFVSSECLKIIWFLFINYLCLRKFKKCIKSVILAEIIEYLYGSLIF